MQRPTIPGLDDRLDALAASIDAEVRASVAPVRALAEALPALRGHLARPALVLACADLFDPADDEHVARLAEMVELIHDASVLHEAGLLAAPGFEDPDAARREAILLGDLLLARSMQLLAGHGSPRVVELVSAITTDLSQGQLLAAELDRDPPEDAQVEARRRRIAELRGGRVFSHCARLGAVAARAPAWAEDALAEYGDAMGTALQLWKDAGGEGSPAPGGADRQRHRAEQAAGLAVGALATLEALHEYPTDPLARWADDLCSAARDHAEAT